MKYKWSEGICGMIARTKPVVARLPHREWKGGLLCTPQLRNFVRVE
jgi:hypothetical protein